MKKRLISILLVFSVVFTLLATSFNVSAAATINKGEIIISTVKAIPGDSADIKISIKNNPGIRAFTISINYDTDALTYEEYYAGDILKDYTVADHREKGYIRFVNCENFDVSADGILIELKFKVADNAEFELHPVSIDCKVGDFCNSDFDYIMPEIISGGVDVLYDGKNCSHKKFEDWVTVAKPTCKTEGTKKRKCSKCEHTEYENIPTVDHFYTDIWTVIKPATKDEKGTMVRYCKFCNAYVDLIEFSLNESEEEKIENKPGTEIPKNDYIEDTFKEQNPDKDFTQNGQSTNNTGNSNPTNNSAPQKKPENSSENKDEDNYYINNETDEYPDEYLSEPDDEVSANIFEKITDVFPEINKIFKMFKFGIFILLFLFLI